MTISSKSRIEELDILKGIAILLMILDHCFMWGPEVYLHKVIQSFHMPLFFIVGGYLWNAKDVRNYSVHKIQTLIRPHFNFAVLYSIIFIGLFAIGKLSGGDTVKSITTLFLVSTNAESTMFAAPLWFLQAFFLTCVVFTFLKFKMGKYCDYMVIVIATIGILYSELYNFMLPFALEPFFTGILFFDIGYKMNNTEWYKFRNYWLQILASIVWFILVYLNGRVDMRTACYYNPLLYIMNGVLGTIVVWNIAQLIKNSRIAGYLKHFSIYSISYLCMHYIFVYYGARVIDKIIPFSHTVARLVLFAIVLVICHALNMIIMKFAPWLIGRKKTMI